MSWLRHWYYLCRAFAWLLLAFGRASWYFKYRALAELKLPDREILSSKEKRRLKHYFYGTTYLSILFCCLRGKPRSAEEKHIFTNLAALAYFFDDLADLFHKNNTLLAKMSLTTYGTVADERGLALHFLNNIYRELPEAHVDQFKHYLHEVFHIETEGRQIKSDQPLDKALLTNITAEKGGYSVLLFRRVLANELSPEEEKAWFEFGHLIQLCDDIFDIWFDVQDGIHTLATEAAISGKIAELTADFEKQVAIAKAALQKTPYAEMQRQTALGAMHIIVSVTRVCLRHYAKLSEKQGVLPVSDRKQMVVDMEKWKYRIQVGLQLAFRK